MDEVFGGLEKDTQDFLIKTSIVDEICAGLCNETANIEKSQQMLEKQDETKNRNIPQAYTIHVYK